MALNTRTQSGQEKEAVRALMREKKKGFLSQAREKTAADQSICRHLQTYLASRRGVCAGYEALPDEVDIRSLRRDVKHLTWALPRVVGEQLEFYAVDESTVLKQGAFGILQPEDSTPVSLDAIETFLVPGLAFDLQGRRMGRGRGFYDRCLSSDSGSVRRAEKVGIAWSIQLVDSDLPSEEHDRAMDVIVTEKGLLRVS